jgi:RNA polymerase primary sigma factor
MINKYLNLEEDSLSAYMRDVRKNGNVITIEKEVELAKKIQKGDSKALDELVNANLRFVIKVAKDYQNQGISVADLINEGNYGLTVAAHKFDYTKGFRFISYAIWWIKQSILLCLNENSRTVRLPGNVINKLSKIKKEIDSFEKENHRLPTEHEVDQIQTPSCTSLNEFINDDNDELVNIIEDKMFKSPDILEDEEEELRNREMKRAMRNLSQREINIINGYFGIDGEPMTLEMIGEEVGLTKERVRQIKESAIRKVRNNLGGIFDI